MMGTIEIHSQVKLVEPIVLATQEDVHFAPISWRLANGDTASVTMDVPVERITDSYQENKSKGNWFVNSRVYKVFVALTLENVAADDLDCLYGRHTSAPSFVVYDAASQKHRQCQEVPELGERVAGEIREAVNLVLRFLHDNYGQYWLRLLTDDEPSQNFLEDVNAKWRESTKPWQPLFTRPHSINIKALYVDACDKYLEIRDWLEIQEAITRDILPPDGFALLADAKDRYHQGDNRIAIIHLNSALEWAVQRFLQFQLADKIPNQIILHRTHFFC